MPPPARLRKPTIPQCAVTAKEVPSAVVLKGICRVSFGGLSVFMQNEYL